MLHDEYDEIIIIFICVWTDTNNLKKKKCQYHIYYVLREIVKLIYIFNVIDLIREIFFF